MFCFIYNIFSAPVSQHLDTEGILTCCFSAISWLACSGYVFGTCLERGTMIFSLIVLNVPCASFVRALRALLS